jgi:beta-N-acetylhexosaminidase
LRFESLKAAAAVLLFVVSSGCAFAQSLEQMAGQMIVVGFQGDGAGDKSVAALRAEIAAGHLGGVMYLKTNVASLAKVKAMNAAFRVASPELLPFITIDQEGGAVERLTEEVGFAELPSAEQVAEAGTPEQAEALYAGVAQRLADLGFSLNFGPVVDLNLNPDNEVIGKFGRSFGADPQIVVDYAAAFIRAHRAAGLLTALKHFPGHGSSAADSHEGFVDITKTWQDSELAPYRALIGAGLADLVMVGHLFNANYAEGEGQLPASLSKRWITDVLRGELDFSGVVISDDLEMGAIREHYSLRDTVVTAVRAGVDVLLFSNTAKYHAGLADEVRAILVAEAAADPAFSARIVESYARIVALKQRIGG